MNFKNKNLKWRFICVYQSAFFFIVRYYLQAMTYPVLLCILKFVNFEKLVVLLSIFIYIDDKNKTRVYDVLNSENM